MAQLRDHIFDGGRCIFCYTQYLDVDERFDNLYCDARDADAVFSFSLDFDGEHSSRLTTSDGQMEAVDAFSLSADPERQYDWVPFDDI